MARIQFNMSTLLKSRKKFYFKQFSLELVHSFNDKNADIFQTIQFSISTQFSSI